MWLVLLVYFIVGMASLSNLAGTFFLKESLPNLTTAQLINIGLLAGLPWSLKMLFGFMMNQSKTSYQTWVQRGLLLSILVTLGTYYFAANVTTLAPYAFPILALLSILGAVGAVVADLAVDTMSISLYPDSDKKTALMQIHARTATVAGGVIGAALSGPVAIHLSHAVALLSPILLYVPAYLSTFFFNYHKLAQAQLAVRLPKKGIYISVAYIVGIFLFSMHPVVLFFLSAGYFFSLVNMAKLPKLPLAVVYGGFGLFLLRTMPGVGPGLTWFYIDELKFDEAFLGRLNLYSNIAGFIGSLGFGWILHKMGSYKAAVACTLSLLVISLPDIIVYYGYHTLYNINPRHIILLAAELSAPLANFMMIILGVMTARHAPDEGRVLYMSLSASLMNLALTAGDALTWVLNRKFPITRGDYSNLGNVLTYGLAISTVLSVVGLLYLKRGTRYD